MWNGGLIDSYVIRFIPAISSWVWEQPSSPVSLVAFAGLLLFFVGFWVKLKQEESSAPDDTFQMNIPAYKARVKALFPFVF